MHTIPSLKNLGLLGALDRPIKLSSAEFAEYLSTSSKTAARILKMLEEEGFVDRRLVAGGQMIQISLSGKAILEKEYADYLHIFGGNGGHEHVELHGHVVTGLGEGQYYIGQEGYQRQFHEKLGFSPYPGTLNIHLTDFSMKLREGAEKGAVIPLAGFTDGERTFGGVSCYRVYINGVEAAVVMPDRTHYPKDLLEIVSPVELRKELKLKDGDEVRIVIDGS
ncbi:riboflavin kinase [Methanohalophilus levihalophilus]|uniref:winged helix-turn-helix domain-containing protein/riboflavin kinase n=1 Tax=Methanohalophilus levihalophilus TaxID=1431282 RepID=UPI001AE3A82D|nr:winged helix-turn-helix domain-containing protein/riboflavin kinase [Methanohalophilus levihalophilus]MBP2029908.1 riboflavin kinase [Methanohalophilus levihalophilus]